VIGIAICWSSRKCTVLPKSGQPATDPSWQDVCRVMHLRTRKMAYTMKTSLRLFHKLGVSVRGELCDPSIAAWMCHPDDKKDYTLDQLVAQYVADQNPRVPDMSPSSLAAKEAVQTWVLTTCLLTILQSQRLLDAFNKCEMPLVPLLARMERKGLGFDLKSLSTYGRGMQFKLKLIENEVHRLCGRKFNIMSPKEFSHILFDELAIAMVAKIMGIRLPSTVRKALNSDKEDKWPSTGNKVLKDLSAVHPMADLVAEYRKLRLTYQKYISPLPHHAVFDEETRMHRVHPSIMQTNTATGRLALNRPNLHMTPNSPLLFEPVRFYTAGSIQEEVEMGVVFEDLSGMAEEEDKAWQEIQFRCVKVRVTSTKEKDKKLRGTLVQVLDKRICEEYSDEVDGSLVDYWRFCDFPYSDLEAQTIRQVKVRMDFGESHPVLSYPADQVFRLLSTVSTVLDPARFRPPTALIPIPPPNTSENHTSEEDDSDNGGASSSSPDAQLVLDWLAERKDFAAPEHPDPPDPLLINIRDSFIAAKGCVLLSADYAQIEVRIIAHFSQDPLLIGALKEQGDVFKRMASDWLEKPIDDVTEEDRKLAKHLCYAILYGSGSQALSDDWKCTVEEASARIKQFKNKYDGVKRFLDEAVKNCRDKGFVETLLGRRRYLTAINAQGRGDRGQAQRQAVNTICQGSAADLVKLAMIDIYRWTHEQGSAIEAMLPLPSTDDDEDNEDPDDSSQEAKRPVRIARPELLLQMHDELIYEVPESLVHTFQARVKEAMEGVRTLRVPLRVKILTGRRWGSLKPYNPVPC